MKESTLIKVEAESMSLHQVYDQLNRVENAILNCRVINGDLAPLHRLQRRRAVLELRRREMLRFDGGAR